MLVLGIPLLLLLYPLAIPAMWDGRRDLRVRFVVIDAATHKPVPGASIHVENGPRTYCGDIAQVGFDLETDRAGNAERLVRGCATYGRHWTVGRVSVARSWNSYTPDWTVFATAPGYRASRPLQLLDRRGEVQRGEGTSELEIVVELSRHEPVAG